MSLTNKEETMTNSIITMSKQNSNSVRDINKLYVILFDVFRVKILTQNREQRMGINSCD